MCVSYLTSDESRLSRSTPDRRRGGDSRERWADCIGALRRGSDSERLGPSYRAPRGPCVTYAFVIVGTTAASPGTLKWTRYDRSAAGVAAAGVTTVLRLSRITGLSIPHCDTTKDASGCGGPAMPLRPTG